MEKAVKKTEIKICGITQERETLFLNEAGVDYAGFVFYEKSKRNVSLKKAGEIMKLLRPEIKKVAVTVSPDTEQVIALCEAGFDILQVHGSFRTEAAEASGLSIWRAVNITDEADLERLFDGGPEPVKENVKGYVADGAGYGGGRPFDWEHTAARLKELTRGRRLILAGGLNAENVKKGIRYFSPDIVDVSSGVEAVYGKSKTKIDEFVRKVREDE